MFTIALNTFLETIRDRILYTVAIFAGLMILGSFFVSEISMHNDIKMIQDLGFSSISLFGIIITLFVGTKMVFAEVNQRTIYVILSKPIERSDFIFGKFFGLSAVLFTVIAVFTLFFISLLMLHGGVFESIYWQAIVLSFFEQLIVLAFAVFFSTFASSPIVAMFCTFSLYIIGNMIQDVYEFALYSENEVFRWIIDVIYYTLPNLQFFNVKAEVVYGYALPVVDMLWRIGYGGAIVALLLFGASRIFEKQEF